MALPYIRIDVSSVLGYKEAASDRWQFENICVTEGNDDDLG
jgi:hypothetical protein